MLATKSLALSHQRTDTHCMYDLFSECVINFGQGELTTNFTNDKNFSGVIFEATCKDMACNLCVKTSD